MALRMNSSPLRKRGIACLGDLVATETNVSNVSAHLTQIPLTGSRKHPLANAAGYCFARTSLNSHHVPTTNGAGGALVVCDPSRESVDSRDGSQTIQRSVRDRRSYDCDRRADVRARGSTRY